MLVIDCYSSVFGMGVVRVIEVVAVLVARMIKYRLVHACALQMHGDLSHKSKSFTAIYTIGFSHGWSTLPPCTQGAYSYCI